MEMMKFNYEFEFDLDDFVEYTEEEGYFDDEVEYNEEVDKKWLRRELGYYTGQGDIDNPTLTIIRNDLKDKEIYVSEIIDRAYEILEEKRTEKEKKQKKKELMEHIRALKDYCNSQDCAECLLKYSCINDVTISGMEL